MTTTGTLRSIIPMQKDIHSQAWHLQ